VSVFHVQKLKNWTKILFLALGLGPGLAKAVTQLLGGERLDHVVADAKLAGFNNRVFFLNRGEHNDGQFLKPVFAANPAQKFQAVHLRHIQIGNHQLHGFFFNELLLQNLAGFVGAGGLGDIFKFQVTQGANKHRACKAGVINDQNSGFLWKHGFRIGDSCQKENLAFPTTGSDSRAKG
jgi:hypothetical protein